MTCFALNDNEAYQRYVEKAFAYFEASYTEQLDDKSLMELVAKKVYTTLKCVMQIHLQGEDWMRLRLAQSTVDVASHSGFGDPKEA